MLEDLAFSVGKDGVIGDVKVVVPAESRPTRGRRRPGLRTARGGHALSPLRSYGESAVEEPSFKEAYIGKGRPRSLSSTGWQTVDPPNAETVLGHAEKPPALPASTPCGARSQEVQTDEMFESSADHPDMEAMHREMAHRMRELRQLQESVHSMRAELKQQTQLAEQYKGQVDVLEEQLAEATLKQQRAEDERAWAMSRLRNLDPTGRQAIPGAAQPPSAKAIKAWSDAICNPAASPRGEPRGERQSPRVQAAENHGATVHDGGDAADGSDESDGEEITIFQRPSRTGRRLSAGM
mmetsp:Transcript_69324/g.129497  ORF Transcript_69324/g.129497 Transcript_69324/m.129497 type:complete len:295 (+) Transcript_69324:97-981(+)